ncbi:MAG: hypothetical protein JF888_03880 [Candidatus Dormibacteraeota bacterium]|uniref:Transposase n=1 Tax=Candidatus Dormiibacter inghamiae TaxID=3127013 RepID=A0A934KCK9_9BACT|nr:hypothetical protein [Candidatus Dormibacteraeota bacterium]MBJ7604928.1 hypothetical protein [Candidatus Dormibacteraeota bacterium]
MWSTRTPAAKPYQVERRANDHKRHGVTSLFAALDVATGYIIGAGHPQHRHWFIQLALVGAK